MVAAYSGVDGVLRMADEKTDTKGESKPELNLTELFGSPEEPATPDKKDVKSVEGDKPEIESLSSSESEVTDPKELQAKVAALTKELGRVRKGKSESTAEVQDVREQLARVQGQLEVLSKGTTTGDTSGENRLAKYKDEQLLEGQTEWEEAIYDAKTALKQARADNDEAAYTKAARELGQAKTTLNAVRKELLERTKRVGVEQAKAQSESSELVQEITSLYENAHETLPDLLDKDSDLWKAGNEVYNRHPKLMKQLGPMAELVATSIALSENPKLIPAGKRENQVARKELLTEINEHAEKSLLKGKGTPNKKVATNFDTMPKGDFEKLIHQLKQA